MVKKGKVISMKDFKNRKSSAKGKILVVDYHRTENTPNIQHAYSAIEEAGYTPIVMRHSEAKKLLKEGVDFADDYEGAFLAGSGKSWRQKGKTTKSGKPLLEYNDPVSKDLVKKGKIPVYTVCHGGYLVYKEINPEKHKIINTEKMHKGIEEGLDFHHKYGMSAEHIDDKLENVQTFNHAGEKLIKSADYGDIHIAQHHAERTAYGRKHIKEHFDKHVKKRKLKKTAGDYLTRQDYGMAVNY